LISIWDSEALEKLKLNVKNGRYSLDGVIEEINGRLIKPLRAQWISRADTEEAWAEVMAVLASR
jgi:hypothetical protein